MADGRDHLGFDCRRAPITHTFGPAAGMISVSWAVIRAGS
jgi:hypothetical protein